MRSNAAEPEHVQHIDIRSSTTDGDPLKSMCDHNLILDEITRIIITSNIPPFTTANQLVPRYHALSYTDVQVERLQTLLSHQLLSCNPLQMLQPPDARVQTKHSQQTFEGWAPPARQHLTRVDICLALNDVTIARHCEHGVWKQSATFTTLWTWCLKTQCCSYHTVNTVSENTALQLLTLWTRCLKTQGCSY